ncbi:MAG TPA: hypothetical protein VHE55_01170 [Fimbriimonadaceae bacterium]|nr:hypothetical protein [Fimbriimonadaceae bacterium]
MSARIEKLVGQATLQALPLVGFRRFGVPTGGAFDVESLLLANRLLANGMDAPAIELANASAEIAFSSSTRIAVVGAPVELDLGAANAAFDVQAGETLRVPAPRDGLCVYVAVAGGWIPDGIESRLARHGRPIVAGDVFEHREAPPAGAIQRLAEPPTSFRQGLFRVVRGPQPILEVGGLRALRVSNQSNRTGIRLDGLAPRELQEMVSEPACPGAVQFTPSGQLIVIGPDGPTIGGYPKPAVVCSVDLDRLAHLRPGQEVAFEEIDLDTARRLAAERDARLAHTLAQVEIGVKRE